MAGKTKIEWVRDADGSEGLSWNALRAIRIDETGKRRSANHCEHVNEACRFCYAERDNARLGGLPFKPGHRKDYTFEIDERKLLEPLRRKKPTRIFVESMSDAFGEWWPDHFIDRLSTGMAECPQHTFINLSKRPECRRQYLSQFELRGHYVCSSAREQVWSDSRDGNRFLLLKDGQTWPLPNVIEGTSVSCQEEADEFVPILLNTPAAIRVVSAEPLLAPIDFTRICLLKQKPGSVRAGIHIDALRGRYCESGLAYTGDWDIRGPAPPESEQRRLDWLIVGGESGPKARPMHPQWARDIRDQCKAAGVAFFYKQTGEWVPTNSINVSKPHALCGLMGAEPKIERDWFKAHNFLQTINGLEGDACVLERVGKKAAGRLLDGVEHNEFPQVR